MVGYTFLFLKIKRITIQNAYVHVKKSFLIRQIAFQKFPEQLNNTVVRSVLLGSSIKTKLQYKI